MMQPPEGIRRILDLLAELWRKVFNRELHAA